MTKDLAVLFKADGVTVNALNTEEFFDAIVKRM